MTEIMGLGDPDLRCERKDRNRLKGFLWLSAGIVTFAAATLATLTVVAALGVATFISLRLTKKPDEARSVPIVLAGAGVAVLFDYLILGLLSKCFRNVFYHYGDELRPIFRPHRGG